MFLLWMVWSLLAPRRHVLAEATGDQERLVCFTLPPGSASIPRTIPGFEHADERTSIDLTKIEKGQSSKTHQLENSPAYLSISLAIVA